VRSSGLQPVEPRASAASAFGGAQRSFPLLPTWDRYLYVNSHRATGAPTDAVLLRNNSMCLYAAEEPEGATVEGYSGCLRHVISYPSSPSRLAWDFIGAFLILYDLFAIPLDVFEPPETPFISGIDWFTLIFWTVNIPASLLVGFVKDGITIMSPFRIAVQYFKTWFMVDLLVVVPDWAFKMHAGEEGSGGSAHAAKVKLLRTLRLLRMVRLLRLLKLRKILQNLNELIDTEYASIVANIVKMIVLLLVINHYIGCCWFLVGSNAPDKSRSWIAAHEFDDVEWGYQYFTAFHWSLTQFTPASMHVQPQNLQERVFAIAVVVFALVGFSYVVGSITGSLTQLRSMQEDTYKQFWNLRRYLKQNRVPMALSARIQRYLEHAWSSQKQKLTVTGTKLFSLLSEQLHSELQCEISLPHLRIHPLFSELNAVSATTVRRIANLALKRKLLARSDTMFIPGESATQMSIVVSGWLEYRRADSTGEDRQERVNKGEDWISEPALWTPAWVHLGGLTAVTECDMVMVEPERFSAVIHRNPSAQGLTVTYAKNFLRWLNEQDPDELSDISQGESIGPTIKGFMAPWLMEHASARKWGPLRKLR